MSPCQIILCPRLINPILMKHNEHEPNDWFVLLHRGIGNICDFVAHTSHIVHDDK